MKKQNKKQKNTSIQIKFILNENTQEHNHIFKHQHKNIKHKPKTKHKKHTQI